jgi:exodeoxyribonuclease VIII
MGIDVPRLVLLFSKGIKMKHFMVDLETLAVSPRSVVLTLGAVNFNPGGTEIYDELYFRINVDEQDKLQRETDPNTLEWWSKQDPKIMEEAFSEENRISVEDAMTQLHKFAWGCDKFWSHGSMFDLVILEDLYKQIGKSAPWQFFDCRDTRTLFDLADADMPKADKHNALADAKRQAVGVQNVYREIGKKF